MLDIPLANAAAASLYARKTLAERAAGRFYTPDVLAADLGQQVVAGLERMVSAGSAGPEVHLCDPFSGDGRLLAAVLLRAATSATLSGCNFIVTLRDVEAAAAQEGRGRVMEVAASVGLNVVTCVEVGDSFRNANPAQHDAVVTNPPWELLKPDVREMAGLSEAAAARYRSWLKQRCAELDARFPDSKADVSYAGWGTNLARCGWDLALRSTRRGGVLGIVLPSTILGDQASVSMRKSVLERAKLIDLAAYPPEARLFEKVDQPVVAAIFMVEPCGHLQATLRLFGADRQARVSLALSKTKEELAADDYALSVGFGAEAQSFLAGFVELPRFKDLEGPGSGDLWAGRELDETRIAAKLVASGRNPFVKGRMVRRHGMAEAPSASIAPEVAQSFKSVRFERLVWRDVSRSSQARRMIGTLIPPGWVAGNSLHLAHFRDGNPERLKALHGVLSSLVFEFQVRSRLATGHMSLGVVRSARIPAMTRRVVASIASAVDVVMADPAQEAALEVKVARAYGLDRDQFAAILTQFPKLDGAMQAKLLSKTLWRSKTQ
jgi:Alw26I/Eco31I/Esp3I family type II restriction m6 adenine DNA methyltransferase